MGKSIFDLTDKTGYKSRWDEDWTETENTNSSRIDTSNSSASSGKVIKLTKDDKFAIKTDFILRFKFYGDENFLYRKDYTITLTCSDSAVKVSPKSLTTENGEVFLFKIYRDKPAKVKLYIAINGVRRYTYDIEFIDPNKPATTQKKSLAPLKLFKFNPLTLTEKQKAQFKAVVLSESSHGFENLWDISWVYFSRITDMGFEKGMRGSTPYKSKNRNYKLWMYYLGQGNEYKDFRYDGMKLSDYIVNNGWFTGTILPRAKPCIQYIENDVFSQNPSHKYKGWHGQGFWGDLNRNPDDAKGDQWYMARQYYLLQVEKKVTNKYVEILVELNGDGWNNDQTTFLFHTKAIEKFFRDNPKMLPSPESVSQYQKNDGKNFRR